MGFWHIILGIYGGGDVVATETTFGGAIAEFRSRTATADSRGRTIVATERSRTIVSEGKQ